MRGTSWEGTPLQSGGGSARDAAERRVALVIGNSAYRTAPLKNPRSDAEAIAAKLQFVLPNFDVTLALDVSRDAMEDALETFEAKLCDCDTGLLYFAGHGLQVKGINFLMPIDADIRHEIHLRRRAFSLNEVLDIMNRRVRTSSLIFLDACRDNPFARSLLAGLPTEERGQLKTRSGLAEVRAGAGSFVAFATAPDNVALDGSGLNSPFTTALLQHMTEAGASINDVMIAVRRDVLLATGGRQEPWDQSSLREHFCFNKKPEPTEEVVRPPVVEIAASDPRESAAFSLSSAEILKAEELANWEFIKDRGDIDELRSHLERYSDGVTERFARIKLEALVWDALGPSPQVRELRDYLEEFSEGPHAPHARKKIADLEARASEALAAEQERARETTEWEAASESTSISFVEAYLKRWPKGRYAKAARTRVRELKRASHSGRRKWNVIAAAFAVLSLPLLIGIAFLLAPMMQSASSSSFLRGILLSTPLILAFGAYLAYRRGRLLTGLEVALYWFGAAICVQLFMTQLFDDRGWNFGFSPIESGLVLGAVLALVAAAGLAINQNEMMSTGELVVYWLGSAIAIAGISVALFDPIKGPAYLQFAVMTLLPITAALLWIRSRRNMGLDAGDSRQGSQQAADLDASTMIASRPEKPLSTTVPGSQDRSNLWLSLAIGLAICAGLVPSLFEELSVYRSWVDSTLFDQRLVGSVYGAGIVIAAVIALISIRLSLRPGSSLPPLEWALYWLAVSSAIVPLLYGLLWSSATPHLGSIIGLLLVVGSGVGLAWRRAPSLASGEVAVYYLGSGIASITLIATSFNSMGWTFWELHPYGAGLLVGSCLSIAAAIVLAWRRMRIVSVPELAAYFFVSVMALIHIFRVLLPALGASTSASAIQYFYWIGKAGVLLLLYWYGAASRDANQTREVA